MHDPYQHIIISGASSGIGYALALQLAKPGRHLALIARRAEKLQPLADEIRRRGAEPYVCCCDVTIKQQVDLTFTQIIERWPRIDLLIANAGISIPVSVTKFNTERIKQLFDVNVFGSLYCIEKTLPIFISQKSGHLVGISSIAAFRSFPTSSPYCASKAALNAFLEGIRIELKQYHVHVTTICPGFIESELTAKNQFKMPFLMKADKAVMLIEQAINSRKKVYIFPWQMKLLTMILQRLPATLFDLLFYKQSFNKEDRPLS